MRAEILYQSFIIFVRLCRSLAFGVAILFCMNILILLPAPASFTIGSFRMNTGRPGRLYSRSSSGCNWPGRCKNVRSTFLRGNRNSKRARKPASSGTHGQSVSPVVVISGSLLTRLAESSRFYTASAGLRQLRSPRATRSSGRRYM